MSLELVIGAARIAFGAVFLLKLWHSIDARDLVWCHRRPSLGGSHAPFVVGLALLLVAAVAFTAGLATAPAALLVWALYVWLFRYASLHCLEDILVQTLCAYFVFAGAGEALSLDALLGLPVAWSRLPAGTLLPEMALAVALGLTLLSAGLEKLRSPLWRSGRACYYFFLLPNVRRLDTHWLTGRRRLMVALNFVTIAFEVGFLPVVLVDARPAGLIVWAIATGFTAMLLIVFVVDFIGEVQLVGLVIVGWLLWSLPEGGIASAAVEQASALRGLDALLGALLVASLVPAVWTVLVPRDRAKGRCRTSSRRSSSVAPSGLTPYGAAPPRVCLPAARAALHPGLHTVAPPGRRNTGIGGCARLCNSLAGAIAPLDRVLRIAARYGWGIMPVGAFTEQHLQGPVVYQVLRVGGADDGGAAAARDIAWPIFTERCRPGPARRLRPTFFETMAYKVTDACVELDREGRLCDPHRLAFILRLAEYAARWTRGGDEPDGDGRSSLVFRITQLNPPAEWIGPVPDLEDWRVDAFRVDLVGGVATAVHPLARPILKYPTGRRLEANRFIFQV